MENKMSKQITEKNKTLWESKEFHTNVTVCCIGKELKPGTDNEYIIHNYFRPGDYNTAKFPNWMFGLRYGI
jgi:hypothetical protein